VGRARLGEQLYADWYERTQTNPGELLVNSTEDVLKKLQNPGFFTTFELPFIATYLAYHPQYANTVVKLAKLSSAEGMLVTTKYSPLTPVINDGLRRLLQTGALDVMHSHHGHPFPEASASPLDTMVLDSRHVGAVFISYALLLGVTSALLFAEIVLLRVSAMCSRRHSLSSSFHFN